MEWRRVGDQLTRCHFHPPRASSTHIRLSSVIEPLDRRNDGRLSLTQSLRRRDVVPAYQNDLDHTDLALLRLLGEDGRMSYQALADEVDLSRPAVMERVKKLEEAGYL
ncbi:MAG: Lrp/AsnC family transcriptional regulator, partial [Gemmatimonadales bacterium]